MTLRTNIHPDDQQNDHHEQHNEVNAAVLAMGTRGTWSAAQVATPIDADVALWSPPEMANADVLIVTSGSVPIPSWQANHDYLTGDSNGHVVRSPTVVNGHGYQAERCSGTSGTVEPSAPGSDGELMWGDNPDQFPNGGVWQPNHSYTFHWVFDNFGRGWASAIGTSGGTEPNWSTGVNAGDTVADGTLTWALSSTNNNEHWNLGTWSPTTVYRKPRTGTGLVFAAGARAYFPLRLDAFTLPVSDVGQSAGSEPDWTAVPVIDGELLWTDQGGIDTRPPVVSGIAAPTSQRAIQVVNAGPAHVIFKPGGSGPTAILDPGNDGPFSLIPSGAIGFAHTSAGWLVMAPYYG